MNRAASQLVNCLFKIPELKGLELKGLEVKALGVEVPKIKMPEVAHAAR